MASPPPSKPVSSEDIVTQKVRLSFSFRSRKLILWHSMTAAVCDRFVCTCNIPSPKLMMRVRDISGGFTSKIVRLEPSQLHSLLLCNNTFKFFWFRRAVVSALASASSHPSYSFAVRDNKPAVPSHSSPISQKTRFRTRVACRSLDRLRCGRRICGLRSVLQPSTHRWRARSPTTPRRVEIAFHPTPPLLPRLMTRKVPPNVDPAKIDRLCT